MKGLKGKVAIVTGGSTGIGLAIVKRLVEEGCKVGVLDILEFNARDLLPDDKPVCFVKCDITRDDQIEQAVKKITDEYGAPSFLVNNAVRFLFRGPDATADEMDAICQTNIRGTSRVTHYVLPGIRKNRGGAIVNISSISGFTGQENFATYTATKFALRGLVRSWAVDLARDNIRVNSVCPGTVHTQGFVDAITKMGMTEKRALQEYGRAHLLNRIAQPSEIASAVAFLLSNDASFITGTDLIVDGGYLAAVEKDIEKHFN